MVGIFKSAADDGLHGFQGKHAFKSSFPVGSHVAVKAIGTRHVAGRRGWFDENVDWWHKKFPLGMVVNVSKSHKKRSGRGLTCCFF